MENLITVVIPCYNHALFLGDAIQSIIDQTYQNFECLIINDGSTDNTEEVVTEWISKDSRVHYYKKENGGLSSARNYGINLSASEYIVTLDADDKYEKTFLEKGIAILLKNNAIGIVSSWGIRFSENNQYGIFKPRGKRLNDFLFRNEAIGTSMFRKKCWIEVGGYDETMKLGYEDWEFYISVTKLGYGVHIIPEILFYYRQHVVSMRIEAINKYDLEIKKYVFIKHKQLYVEYYPELITNFLAVIDHERSNVAKLRASIEFSVGFLLIKPFRFVKKIIKK